MEARAPGCSAMGSVPVPTGLHCHLGRRKRAKAAATAHQGAEDASPLPTWDCSPGTHVVLLTLRCGRPHFQLVGEGEYLTFSETTLVRVGVPHYVLGSVGSALVWLWVWVWPQFFCGIWLE